jgi:hypothetical protein
MKQEVFAIERGAMRNPDRTAAQTRDKLATGEWENHSGRRGENAKCAMRSAKCKWKGG